MDQTVANIQTVKYAAEQGCKAWLCDGQNMLTYIKNDSVVIPATEGYKLSVFSYGITAEGVSLCGTKYPLVNGTLSNSYPLGVSNEFSEEKATVTVNKGELIIILSRD